MDARLQPRRRRLQHQPRRRQPLLWPMNADPPPPPPPWVWMVPGSAGLLRLGAGVAPPPVLLASAQPPAGPLLPGLPAWQAPGEPLLPLLPLPSAPDHAAAAAAAHRYPALNGQVTRPRPRPRARGGRRPPGPGRRPRPHSRGPGPVARTHPSRGGPRAPSPPGRSLAAMRGQQSSRSDVPFRLWQLLQVFLPGLSLGSLETRAPKPESGLPAPTLAPAGVAVQSAVLKSAPQKPSAAAADCGRLSG